MKKLLVIAAKCIGGVIGIYIAICIGALLIGAGKGIAWQLSPEGRADIARYNAEVKEFNESVASSRDQD